VVNVFQALTQSQAHWRTFTGKGTRGNEAIGLNSW